MIQEKSALRSMDRFRRTMMLTIIVMAMFGTLLGWYIMVTSGRASTVLQRMQAVTAAVLSILFVAHLFRLLPQRVVEMCSLLYAVCICMACMILRMYWPAYGTGIDLEPLYLWFPVLYVFAFMLTDHRTGLVVSLLILALFMGTSLPYLIHDIDGPDANITVQMHVVSAALIVTLYFYSGYRHRLHLAQTKVHELANLSNTDELTGLANRRAMASVIDGELARRAEGGGDFALMLFDIDRFKEVNDGFGHGEGDKVLVALSQHARGALQGMGILGRWGGDEFVAMVRNADAVRAMRLADALCAGVASSPLVGDHQVTISCGVTVAGSGDSMDSLLQRADAALYAAKRAGRNRAQSILEQR